MRLIYKLSEDAKVPGEDWDSLMWHNGKLFSGSYANGKVKVWSAELKLLRELDAHDYPIYHMTGGNGTTFFTSSSDCTIRHWDEKEDGTFQLLASLEGHTEPARKLRFLNGRLYSGDEKGDVKVWEDGKCLGTIETMEEIWDMLALQDHFATVRHIDVTLYSLSERDNKLTSCVKNSFPGRAPMHVVSSNFCCVDRNENVINVHSLGKLGNPKIGNFKGHEAIINAMTSVGNHLISGACDNKVIAWNLDSLKEEGSITLDGYVNVLAASQDGNIYAAGENKFIACLKM